MQDILDDDGHVSVSPQLRAYVAPHAASSDRGVSHEDALLLPPAVVDVTVATVRPRRRWLRLVLAGVLVVLLAVLLAWGISQHSAAADWRTRAGDLDAELAEARTKLSTANDQVSVLTAQVEDLTTRGHTLEEQVATLANEKAVVEDESAQLSVTLATAPSVTAALRQCAASNLAVSAELVEVIGSYPYRSFSRATSLLEDANRICGDAITKTNGFESTLRALGI